jgi:RND family efflux transporter MFP subunit
VLPLVVLGAGVWVALYFLRTAPVATQRAPDRRDTLVQVEPVRLSDERVVVEAMGAVTPARSVEVHARVSGEVMEVSRDLVPGGIVRANQTLLRIDAADYELAVRRLEGDVAQAQANLELELGNQSIAEKEYALLGEVVRDDDRDLVLRKPQLVSVQAAVDQAKAALARARLDLERTSVRAPFNAVVRSRGVDQGARVAESTVLATLVGTDAYWVEAAVPVDDLKWLRIPRDGAEQGSSVRVYDPAARGSGAFRPGRVIRLAAALEEQGRMAQVLVEVRDPLALQPGNAGRPALLLGSYVRVEIEGGKLPSVAAVDRALLRDDDTVWVLDRDGRLEIRPVEIAFRGRDRVLVSSGVEAGDQIVTTDLSAPVQGMALRTQGSGESRGNGFAENGGAVLGPGEAVR